MRLGIGAEFIRRVGPRGAGKANKMNRRISNSLPLLWLAGGLAFCATAQVPAQENPRGLATDPARTADSVPNPQLKPNPIDALRKFEPAADEEYRLGKGDE